MYACVVCFHVYMYMYVCVFCLLSTFPTDEDTSMDTLSIILRELREGLQSLQASSSEGSEFDSAESSLLQGVYENISHIEELAKQTWVISDTALRKVFTCPPDFSHPLSRKAADFPSPFWLRRTRITGAETGCWECLPSAASGTS